MTKENLERLSAQSTLEPRRLTLAEFQGLAELPPEVTWFANIRNPNTRRAYERDVKDFSLFIGIQQVEEYRLITRAHVIAWRHDLERKGLSPATIRRKLSALSSLFDSLCEANAVTHAQSCERRDQTQRRCERRTYPGAE